jgi:hypothetical protein
MAWNSLLIVGDRFYQDFIQGLFGSPAYPCGDFGDIRGPNPHILKAFPISLFVRNKLEGRRTLCQGFDFFGQSSDRYFYGIADIEDFSPGRLRGMEEEPIDSFHGVAHMEEGSALLTIAIYRDGFPS